MSEKEERAYIDREIARYARIEALEECERLCLKKVRCEAEYHGRWGSFDDDMTAGVYMTGPECAAKIRALRLHDESRPTLRVS